MIHLLTFGGVILVISVIFTVVWASIGVSYDTDYRLNLWQTFCVCLFCFALVAALGAMLVAGAIVLWNGTA